MNSIINFLFVAFISIRLTAGFPATLFPDPSFQDFPIPDTVEELDPMTVVNLFIEFEREYQKEYMSPLDQAKARAVFQFNVENIIRLNQQYANESLRFGINYYTDFSDLEFKEKVANLHVDTATKVEGSQENSSETLDDLPISFDWRDRNGTVGGVSNQGYCGCSWGFTVASVVQSAYSIKNSKFLIPSEQQLCDCAQGGNPGCGGGSVKEGFEYVKENGVVLEANYQKNVEKQQQMYCAPQKDTIRVSNYKFIQPSTASQIQKTLLSSGPVAVGFKVSNSFRHYESGVFNLNDCDSTNNFIGWHSVTIVGYGTENGQDFWIAKNSWSPSFGEEGFFRIAKNIDLCQIESKMPSYVEI